MKFSVARWLIPTLVSLALVACGGPSADVWTSEDVEDFMADGHDLTHGVSEGSPDALGVLKVVNTADLKTLDDAVGLDARAAKNLYVGRVGPDGTPGSPDDETYDTLAEVDAVPYVGSVAFNRLLTYARANGYSDGTTVVVDPADMRGYLEVTVPAKVLPSWAPATPPTWGPTSVPYDDGLFHVYSGQNKIASSKVGTKVFIPKGSYTVALNDTKTSVTVTQAQTTTVAAGRLEVVDVAGTFKVTAKAGDFSNGSQVLDATFNTGVGLNVLAGEYTVDVTYQAHTKPFAVTVGEGERRQVSPDDLRGYLVVTAPVGASLPDWAPASVPTYGPGNHAYSNGTYYVYSGTTLLGSAKVGEPFFAPEGSYTVALNDTKATVSVVRGVTQTLQASRIEVEDAAGTFKVTAKAGDFSNGSQVLDATIPTGVGFNVLSGAYSVNVSYQLHTKTFEIQVAPGETRLVSPDDLRGYLVVTAPAGATLPDWAPASKPTFGPGNHPYANDTYLVYSGTTHLATKKLGDPYFAPEGTYTVALNDTKTTVTIVRGVTQTVSASRLEVADVSGSFKVTASAGDFSNGSQVLDTTIPTGVGFNVLAGSYSVAVTYQAHTKTFTPAIAAGQTHTVAPDDLRGFIRIDPPLGVTMPDWAPTSKPTFGPAAHPYSNDTWYLYKGTALIGSEKLGVSLRAPEGTYTLVLNDTKHTLTIGKGTTTSMRAGRIEVSDVSGTYKVTAKAGDFSNGTQVLDATIPTGYGFNVMPGQYDVAVTYQNQTQTHSITIPVQ